MPTKTHGRPLRAPRWRERTPRAAGRAGHAVDAVDTAVAVSVELKRKKSFESLKQKLRLLTCEIE